MTAFLSGQQTFSLILAYAHLAAAHVWHGAAETSEVEFTRGEVLTTLRDYLPDVAAHYNPTAAATERAAFLDISRSLDQWHGAVEDPKYFKLLGALSAVTSHLAVAAACQQDPGDCHAPTDEAVVTARDDLLVALQEAVPDLFKHLDRPATDEDWNALLKNLSYLV